MTIDVRIIADSINQSECRLTTFHLRYPRFIHSQIMTHRVFSRSAASSRAIPVATQIKSIREDPAIPVEWSQNGRGMSPKSILDEDSALVAKDVYQQALNRTLNYCEDLSKLGVHKQYANRLLEPFAHIDVVLSGTDFKNFFALRLAHDAQNEIRILAEKMLDAMMENIPSFLMPEEWHLPYILPEEKSMPLEVRRKISAARCARVSYKAFNSDLPSSVEDDLKLCHSLIKDVHASPFEHIAMALAGPYRIANYRGWLQYRLLLDQTSQQ